jgi:predicted AAA+ superfamily ATPase
MRGIIDRPGYLNILLSWRGKADVIKAVTGIRRCGKSTMFKIFKEKLLDSGVSPAQIQELNNKRAGLAARRRVT